MQRWFVLVVTGLTALAALTAVSAAAPGERASAAAAAPVISSVSPKTLASGQRTTIKGRRFVTGKRRNTVVFLGRRGKRDDVRVKATATTTRKIVLKAPRVRLTAANARASAATQAVSGPLQVINALGKSKPSRAKVTFDQDKDGLSNEREIQLGTNPRKADTDGDGVRDGVDSDPLHAPGDGSGIPGGGQGGPPPIPTDCPAAGVAAAGAGPASSFGLGNVLSEARSLVSHSAVVGATKYCLYRKTATTAYRLVGSGPGPDAGVITDGGSPTRNDDYEFRTDALTATGVVAGSNSLNARGATVIPGATGWAGLNQGCASCGDASVAAPSLQLSAPSVRTGRRGGLDRGLRAPARAKPGRRVVCPPTESADTGRRRICQRQSHHLRSAPGDRPRWRGDWRRDSRSSTSSSAATQVATTGSGPATATGARPRSRST